MEAKERLNHDMIDSLKELDDGSFFSELIDLYLEHAPRLILAIEEAFNRGDFEGLQATAHKLKGSCGNVGARFMAEIAGDIEKNGSSLDREMALQQVNLLKEEQQWIEAALRREVEAQAAHFHARDDLQLH